MFKSTMNKGVTMKFENGYKISIQFGEINYCTTQQQSTEETSALSAEVAIFEKDKMLKVFPSYGDNKDYVEGWVDTDKVAKIIEITSNASSQKDIKVGLANLIYNKDSEYVK